MGENFGVLVTARATEFWSLFYLRLWKIIVAYSELQ